MFALVIRWVGFQGLWGDRIRDNYTHMLTNTCTFIYIYLYIIVSILSYLLFIYTLQIYINIYIILRKSDTRPDQTALSRLTSYKLQPHVFLAYLSITHCVYINELLVYVRAQTSYGDYILNTYISPGMRWRIYGW